MTETKTYVENITNRFKFKEIEEIMDKLNNLSILVIGDTIIDQYTFVEQKGRATKDPILSTGYKNEELHAGGILAMANHLSSFVKNIKLVTLIGDKNSMIKLIEKSIKNNTEIKTFIKENSPTTIKKRIIDYYRGNKLFKIEHINDKPINEKLTEEIIRYLDKEISKYDVVLVGDFGHGFINNSIRRKLEQDSKFLAINVQSNSSNLGFNYFTLYNKFDFLSLNENEIRLPLLMRFEKIEEVIKQVCSQFKLLSFLITRGQQGCNFVNNGKIFKAPILIKSVKDTVGSGDAVFAMASLLTYQKADNELIPFLANSAGGIASNILGNKESINKEALLKFIKGVYEDGVGRV